MDRQLDFSSVNTYCESFTNHITNNFFENKEVIHGSEILKLTNVEQLNLLIIKRLFDNWRLELAKLESPYFNYNHPDVKVALSSFINVLSRNIEIKENDFQPILKDAIQDAILLSLAPYKFYKDRFFITHNGKVKRAYLEDCKKYIKCNRILLDKVIEKFDAFNLKKLPLEDVLNHMNDTYQENGSLLSDDGKIVNDLAQIYPIEIEDLCLHRHEERLKKSIDSKFIEKQEVNESDLQKTEIYSTKLNDNFKSSNENINDQFKNDEQKTVADSLSQVHDLKKAIGINQKFMFVNILFNGKNEEFDLALSEVEKSTNSGEAKNFLLTNFGLKYSWDKEGSEVQAFLKLVEKRFN